MSETELTKLEKSIEAQCSEFESILDYLRDKRFSEEKYRRFYRTMEAYSQAINDLPVINRETAGYLDAFRSSVEWAFLFHDNEGNDRQLRDRLQAAWEETNEIVYKIWFGDLTKK